MSFRRLADDHPVDYLLLKIWMAAVEMQSFGS